MTGEKHQYYWWMNKARDDMAGLITQMGLNNCPVCDGQSMMLLPWPAVVAIGGLPWKPLDDPYRGNVLFMALVRCERCGYAMMFDSEKLTGRAEPPGLAQKRLRTRTLSGLARRCPIDARTSENAGMERSRENSPAKCRRRWEVHEPRFRTAAPRAHGVVVMPIESLLAFVDVAERADEATGSRSTS